MAQIVVEMSADDAKLYRAFVKIMAGQDQMEQGFKKVKKSSDTMGDGLGKVIGSIASMAASWLSVNAAINMAVSSQQAYNNLTLKAKEANIAVATAQREALVNFAINDPKKQEDLIDKVKAMHARVQFAGGEAGAWRALSAAGAATGSDEAKSLEIAEMAGRFDPLGENTKEMSGAFGDLQKVGMAPKEAMGAMTMALGKYSRSTTQKQIAQHLVPAVAKWVKFGATVPEAIALVTSLQQHMMDEEGALTKTASMAFAGSIQEFLPKEDRYDDTTSIGGKKTLVAKGTGIENDPVRSIKNMQKDPKLRAFFIAQARFGREQGKVNIEEMIGERTNATFNTFEKHLTDMPPQKEWAPAGMKQIETMDKAFSQMSARANKLSSDESLLLNTATGKRLDVQQDWSASKIADLMYASGAGHLDVLAARAKYFEPKTTNREVGQSVLSQRVAWLEKLSADYSQIASSNEARGTDGSLARQMANDSAESAKALQDKLGQMIEISQKQLDAINERNRAPQSRATEPQTAY